jgi:hypothetical protein
MAGRVAVLTAGGAICGEAARLLAASRPPAVQ